MSEQPETPKPEAPTPEESKAEAPKPGAPKTEAPKPSKDGSPSDMITFDDFISKSAQKLLSLIILRL